MIADFDEAHRPPLTADDRAALREYSDMGWTVNGRWISLGQILDAWTDAAHRTPDSETLRAALGTLRAQEAKGRGKYGSDLDGAGLSALALNSHKIQELADALMYAVAEQKAIESLAARVAELEASLSSTETHRQSLAHELSRAQQLDEASLKTIARKDRRIEQLEAENATLRERLDYYGGFADPDRPSADPPDFAHPSPAPTTRPLTTADRLPERGDVVQFLPHPRVCSGSGPGGASFLGPGVWLYSQESLKRSADPYISRADGGPVTVEVQP